MRTQILKFMLPTLIIIISIFSNNTELKAITEGQDYWIGIPYVKMKQPEYIRGDYPIVIWISSRVNTIAHYKDPETGIIKDYNIRSNQVTEILLGDFLMNKESEIVTNLGIHITADAPVSVTVFMSYQWSGEAFRVLPTECLGTEYMTLNLYQDETDEMKPAQILVVATQDSTHLTYTPTYKTEKSLKDSSRNVTLNKGQTFLILGALDKSLTQNWASDLTGTYLSADKPISVISGHTKGTFPFYQVGYVYTGDQNYANFSRNLMIEQMLPIDMLGTEYVSAELKYNNRVYGGSKVQDERGDLIRFVAAFDSTKIYQMRPDGSGLMKIGPTLNKGEWYNITNQEDPACYKTTKPVLVGQYGKEWWSDPGMMGGWKTNKKDQPQNPWQNGQGMMFTLTPVDRWYDYATFKSPDNIDNFIYLTFMYSDRDSIYFDGVSLASHFGGMIKTIRGTDYAYITTPIGANDHFIEGRNGAKFAGYAYGNWDRCKDGFAYGYNLGVDFAKPCEDSVFITDTNVCGFIKGSITAMDLQQDSTCAGLLSVNTNNQTINNYRFVPQDNFYPGDKTFNYRLFVSNIYDSAFVTIEALTKSGKTVNKSYTYYPEVIKPIIDSLNFSKLKLNQKLCLTNNFWNASKNAVTITGMYINNNSPEFEITPLNFPITLQQNDTAKIEVCATVLPQSGNNPKDAVIFKTNCNEYFLFDLELQPDLPYLRTGDVNFYQTYINYEVSKWFYVDNVGFGEAEIYGITWKDSLHFTHTDLSATLNNPLIIAAGESYRFNVYYKADEGQVVSTDTAFLLTNATKSKLFSVWTGTGPLTVNLISPTNLSQKNPINALLSWTDMGKNYTYHLIIATDQYFNNIVKDTNTDKTIYPSHLSANTKYYWKVQPVHNGNPQAFVTYWIFETDTSISGVENNFNENANDIEIFPNPANSFLTINYCLDKPAAVNMKITNLFGEDLIILKDGNQVEAGKYSANIKIDNLRDGMYFLVCKIGSRVQGIKFVKAD